MSLQMQITGTTPKLTSVYQTGGSSYGRDLQSVPDLSIGLRASKDYRLTAELDASGWPGGYQAVSGTITIRPMSEPTANPDYLVTAYLLTTNPATAIEDLSDEDLWNGYQGVNPGFPLELGTKANIDVAFGSDAVFEINPDGLAALNAWMQSHSPEFIILGFAIQDDEPAAWSCSKSVGVTLDVVLETAGRSTKFLHRMQQ